MKRFTLGFATGAAFLSILALTFNLFATFKISPPRYALINTFQPQPAWTLDQAQSDIAKFKSRLSEEKVKGLEIKYFLGALDRNEFGGFYQFKSKVDLDAYLEKKTLPKNRTVKVFEILDSWKGN